MWYGPYFLLHSLFSQFPCKWGYTLWGSCSRVRLFPAHCPISTPTESSTQLSTTHTNLMLFSVLWCTAQGVFRLDHFDLGKSPSSFLFNRGWTSEHRCDLWHTQAWEKALRKSATFPAEKFLLPREYYVTGQWSLKTMLIPTLVFFSRNHLEIKHSTETLLQ